ncbi:MAG: glycosyl hydrolase family 8 [Reichenbachiella sp.]
MRKITTLIVTLMMLSSMTMAQSMVNATYPHGNMPSGRDGGAAIAAYNSWKNEYVEWCGDDARVRFDDPSQSVSEGIVYGMLLAAYGQDRDLLDGLTRYYNKFKNADGVMDWRIQGCSHAVGFGGAADAEFDYATAMIVADKLWGSGGAHNYGELARDMIGIIKAKEIAPSGTPRPGPGWGGDNITNPSYYTPGYFRLWGEYTNDQSYWNGVAAKCYEILANVKSVHNASFGIVPDWCTSSGNFSPDAANYFSGGQRYHYDAARTPWRIATDYIWYGTSEASEYINQAYQFADEKGGLSSIVDGYFMDGTPYGSSNAATFSGSFATAYMLGSAGQNKVDGAYNYLVGKNPNGYFNTTLYVLYMYTMTGNFWNPLDGGPPACEVVSIPSNGTATIQSEDWCAMDGVQTEPTDDNGGGLNVGFIDADDWMSYEISVPATGNYTLAYRVASATGTGELQIDTDAGQTLLGNIAINTDAGWQNWTTVSHVIALPQGNYTIGIKAISGGWNINWFSITGGGSNENNAPVANAGSNQSVQLPATSATLSGSATDADGDVLSFSWTQVSGPNNANIANASNASTTVDGLVAGTYTFSLTATDGQASDTDMATVTVATTGGGSNLLTNGDFSNGLSSWTTFIGGAGSGSIVNSNGQAQAAITNGGDAVWNIQLYQAGLTIENGASYTLSFDASASANRPLEVSVEHNGSPWTNHMIENVNLTSASQSFTFNFTASNATDTDGRVTFNMGTSGVDVFVDNVVLSKGGTNPTEFTLATNTSGSGSVTISPAAASYANGTVVTATAQAAAGWHFVNWSGNASGTNEVVTVTMDSNKSITANFAADGNNNCDNPTVVALPFSHTGPGDFCWVTSGSIDFVNSWNAESITINGEDITNAWEGNLPARIDGNYYIEFSATIGWAHFEIEGSGGSARVSNHTDELNKVQAAKLSVYPNPASSLITIDNVQGNYNTIQVIGIDGKVQLTHSITDLQQVALNISSLDRGVFIINLLGANEVQTIRFIKN